MNPLHLATGKMMAAMAMVSYVADKALGAGIKDAAGELGALADIHEALLKGAADLKESVKDGVFRMTLEVGDVE